MANAKHEWDVFVSHNSKQKPWVRAAVDQWRRLGLKVFFDEDSIDIGESIAAGLERGLEGSRHIVFVITPDSVASEWVAMEAATGIYADPSAARRKILPIMLEETLLEDIRLTVRGLRFVKLTEPTTCLKEYRRLLKAMGVKDWQQEPLPDLPGPIPVGPPKGPRALRITQLSNLPPRNGDFTGRVEQLEELHQAVQAGGLVAITQVIKGLGGVGKTQTAVEYGHRHAGEYDIRWLIRAETQQQMKIDLAKLGVLLDKDLAEVADLEQQVEYTLQLLNNAESALLIYDNVEQPSDITGLYPTAAGHVLITSRYTDWQTVARAVSLHTFTEGEAMDYFRRRELTDDEEDLKALTGRLGYLPLALAMAAGYMGKQRISAGEYLGEYESDQSRVLAAAALPQDYDRDTTLAAVFERSFAAAGEQDPLAMELLESLAFLAPDDIPLFVLAWPEGRTRRHISEELAEALADERQQRELISTLVDYSLVSRADDTLSIHRLTQDVLRNRLRADEALRGQRLYAAIELVDAHVAHDVDTNLAEWPIMDALTPHIRALREAMADVPPANCHDPCLHMLAQFALHCWTRAEYAEASACFERAMEIGEATLGPDDPIVATHVNNLGSVLQAMGKLPEAKRCFERALKIDEATYGPDHPEVATDVNNLGSVLQDMDDLGGAKECYERALKIDEATYGPDHPDVAADVSNLGSVLLEMGDLPGAKERFERALKIYEATYGPDHPNVATVVNNLGGVLQDMDELPEAKRCYERALKIGEATLGPDHPKVAIRVNNLGGVLGATGDTAGEKACYERAIEIGEATLGLDHPEVATWVNNLGGVLVEMGKFAEAKPHLERAVAIRADKLGPEHPSTRTAMGWLERVKRELGE